ncbi:hypothetical protein J437_LFUL017548 [Ladona fulva]|uniref:Uncharacterized protein n=1 Tax=Ladona fulva TaxID=123851 RepID=A0A8K0KLW2_LADFU|nr:hypothetical protein J437_LFUL017548 [Ladona fulva]
MKLRDEGDEATSKLLKEVTTWTPTRARRVLSRWRKTDHIQSQLSGEEALSLIISSELTKRQYKILRETAKNHGHMLYPSYEIVRKAKYAAYPDGIRVTEDFCEVDLQALVLHTASRIVASVSTVLSSRKKINSTLICKYGFDGSSGHSIKTALANGRQV